MSFKHVMAIYDMMDSPALRGEDFKAYLEALGTSDNLRVEIIPVAYEPPEDPQYYCDFVRIYIQGSEGKMQGGSQYPTLGVIGRLGAQGALPERVGQVSDADGSTVALSTAATLWEMSLKGARLKGDVIITTHVANHVSIEPHEPVDFMGMPVSSATMNEYEVLAEMDAIISVDTSKGNTIINHRGMALSATAKEGYILRVAPDLVKLMELTTGRPAVTFPITTQDITDYSNGVYHFNSIMQPHVATSSPVVGLAITASSVVPGSETGASYITELHEATQFVSEVAKQYTWKRASFYDSGDYARLVARYGKLDFLQQ
ncbi:DUF1177 domain-containing protein [Serratia quinivorans]|uniref:DUF1177 domain-containing protein n=1 Tax=Serratia quinivorans TaxID=137545 RepID=UPI002178E0CF|nr:DUF1177 domain-containing protein [Serratia quinivorans]CAI0994254.1 Protein of uncharacterised function (DUF1177) [Serratia quinivorans]CAI1794246.1 Protein of uncharacterised function (DUF1177) [Serratia quinivorans]